MARENFVLKTLMETGSVSWSPHGNSMTPKIQSGERVVVKRIASEVLQAGDPILCVGDVVYARVKGNYYLHLLSAIDESQGRYQISNNHGHVNGWVSAENVFGICVQVGDKVLLTDDALIKRTANNLA